MKPYYEDSHVKIYHGDCRVILPLLDPVDLIVTDPPYGINTKMQGGTWGKADKYSDMWKWDYVPEKSTFDLIFKLSKKIVVWGGNYFNLPPSRCWYVWDKCNAVHTVADCELAWTSFDKPVKRLSHPVGVHNTGHPTQKPLKLMTWCISISGSSESILDPFMGSGTTLRAAKDLNRKAIGIELEEKYCEIAAQRMCQEVLEL